ncbi:MAG TPA: glycosyltransferase [Saprospiraceae bacterium]|nr:glycosyltransferase [Saprospiraceae bacterium]HPG09547.1 glycosyltransferase [Saprospiraceae bacterium]HQU52264.1 glycosyltransferase [Saprospiraceae bacterium]HRV87045.1 glycosyltransferase [Saprospiraceae bacterium]
MQTEKLSLILLSYQSEKQLPKVVTQIRECMEQENIPLELLIMDDGSTDASFQIAKGLEQQYADVIAYRLSRNYGSTANTFAGLSRVTGACAALLSDDLQTPLDVLVQMYRRWQEGARIIVPYRMSRRDGWRTDLPAKWYYRIMNAFSDAELPRIGTDGWLIDREVIDIVNERISPRNTKLSLELFLLGFDPVLIPFERPTVDSVSRWTLRKKFKLAMDTFFSVSTFPIKVMSGLGLVTFVLCFILAFVLAVTKLFFDNSLFGFPIPGWTTIMVLITMFNGIILFSIGIVAEYIWRIYEEVKGRPGYIIRKEDPKKG